MNSESSQSRVRHCSICDEDTEYYCESCSCDLCFSCKENHLQEQNKLNHKVVTYWEKYNYNLHREINMEHSDHDMQDKKDTILYSRIKSRENKEEQIIHLIRSEALFYRPIHLTDIKADIKNCHKEFSLYQSEMLRKAKELQILINIGIHRVDFKHRCSKELENLIIYMVCLELFEHKCEQSAFTPVQFLKAKTQVFSKLNILFARIRLHTCRFSMTESFSKKDVMESLSGIQITKGQQMTSRLELLKSFTLSDGFWPNHISHLTSNRVWISNNDALILTNIASDTLFHLNASFNHSNEDVYSGIHTVNNECELIFIDEDYNITKLSKDMKTTTTFIKRPDTKWEPRCVHWSSSTGDLLVGMDGKGKETSRAGKVVRYNQFGKQTQTIPRANSDLELYSYPRFLTENNNGDVVVSDFSFAFSDAVVVTDCEGRHRFSYKGHPPESSLYPRGICTDELSHILVCDSKSNTVQLLNKDGQFQSYLLVRPPGVLYPDSLSYDVNSHRLWVGSSFKDTVCVYKYIPRHGALTGKSDYLSTI